VGIIVKHYVRYAFHNSSPKYHHGVIIGWHHKYDPKFVKQLTMTKTCQFPYLCPEYVDKSICKECVNTIGVPYYIILSENNKICYVRQGMNIYSILIKL